MKKRHKDILISEIPNIDPNKTYGTICWVGSEFKGNLIRNVKLYEFQNMYPQISCYTMRGYIKYQNILTD